MHAGLSSKWRKDTITNEFDLSSIFIVCDVKYNINMPSQIIVMAQEVYTNVSRTEEKQKRKPLNEAEHTNTLSQMEIEKNRMRHHEKSNK